MNEKYILTEYINKINNGGELLYSNLPKLPIIAKPELSAKALNGEANYEIIQQSKQNNFENQI